MVSYQLHDHAQRCIEASGALNWRNSTSLELIQLRDPNSTYVICVPLALP
jgi:hypothetical protein